MINTNLISGVLLPGACLPAMCIGVKANKKKSKETAHVTKLTNPRCVWTKKPRIIQRRRQTLGFLLVPLPSRAHSRDGRTLQYFQHHANKNELILLIKEANGIRMNDTPKLKTRHTQICSFPKVHHLLFCHTSEETVLSFKQSKSCCCLFEACILFYSFFPSGFIGQRPEVLICEWLSW